MKTCEEFSHLLLWLIFTTSLPVFWAQKIEVLSQVTGYVGHNVTLPCSFIQGTKYSNITQSQWELLSPDGNKTLIMVSSKQYGKSVHESHLKGRVDMEDQSLLIKNVELSDSGSYVCTIAIFPLGSSHNTTKLHVSFQGSSSGCSAGCIGGIMVGCLVVAAVSAGGFTVYKKQHNGKPDPPPPHRAEQNNIYEEMSAVYKNVGKLPKALL
ncbi:hypothetical protein OJAV_G00161770 [Oryzias javanicus]|uniref:Ig-like domain-containing protein n=1 Tax=Oryzias javanicus TaxID=123683 RepID=A0A437CJW9_ORYJA|nr:hypothetical protein OJAV_G00161770 [Oryzias javanicus]